jgi:hypothetical protein
MLGLQHYLIFHEKSLKVMNFVQVLTRGQDSSIFITDIQTRAASGDEDLHQDLEALSLSTNESKSGFRAYSRADAVEAAEKALDLHSRKFPGAVLKFTVSPGQVLFAKKYGAGPVSDLVISKGRIGQEELENKKVMPFFNSFPLTTNKTSLVRHLDRQGYHLMTMDDRPDSFTIIHLLAGPEELFAR